MMTYTKPRVQCTRGLWFYILITAGLNQSIMLLRLPETVMGAAVAAFT